ncbi:hypothetical protein [Streptomyces luteireticuli]|uniref:hypothetical protein n=1 Tax=Streptomyces luteireticuli TaxID=173858 RepID=UPI0035587274
MFYFFHDEPRVAPFNADELTEEHVAQLRRFLQARVEELRERHPAGSPEERAAQVLHESVATQIDELAYCFDDEEPATLKSRLAAWNKVIFAIWPWETAEGYDTDRWRQVRHTDIDDAVEGARSLLKAREEQAERKHAEREAP